MWRDAQSVSLFDRLSFVSSFYDLQIVVASIILNIAVLVSKVYFVDFPTSLSLAFIEEISLVIFDRVFLLTLMSLVLPFLE
jgi:hypothetical protein